MPERRYSEQEVAEIVRLASDQSKSFPNEGMTLAEVQAVTAELGLDAHAVRTAANLVDEGVPWRKISRSSVEFERSYPGVLDDALWEEVVAEVRRETGFRGEVKQRGSTREWSSVGEFQQTFLAATTKNGITRFRFTATTGGFMFLTILGCALPMLMSFGISMGVLKKGGDPSIVWPVLGSIWLLFTALALRSILRSKRQLRDHEGLLDRLGGILKPAPVETSLQRDQLANTTENVESPNDLQF